MRILVTGSRDWKNDHVIIEALSQYDPGIDILVHGACPTGADHIAQVVWDGRVEAHPAEWQKYGKHAGFMRNRVMVNLGADVCLAFIRNNSKGASHTAKIAEQAGIEVKYYRSNDE